MTASDNGLNAAEAAALARLAPDLPAIGAGLSPDTMRLALAATPPGLILAIIPDEALTPAPGAGAEARGMAGAALLWLVRAAAPRLAPARRVVAVAGLIRAPDASTRAVIDWLRTADSVTGQLVTLDGPPPPRGP